jgi:hypothetical protein
MRELQRSSANLFYLVLRCLSAPGPTVEPCRPKTLGLLHDPPLVVDAIRHVGMEENELEVHRVGLVTEGERQLEYHASAFEDPVAKLWQIPTKVIAEATGLKTEDGPAVQSSDVPTDWQLT